MEVSGAELIIKYYLFIFLNRLRKNAECGQVSRSSGRGMNPVLFECASRAELLVTAVRDFPMP
jgi:hypothetical protein